MNFLDITSKIRTAINKLKPLSIYQDGKYKAGYNAGIIAACDCLQDDIGNCYLIDGTIKPQQTVYWVDYNTNQYKEDYIAIAKGTVEAIGITIRETKQTVLYHCIRHDAELNIKDRLISREHLYTTMEEAEKGFQEHIESRQTIADRYCC